MNDIEEKKQRIAKIIKWAIIWLAVAIASFFIEAPYNETDVREIMEKISNCFTVSGVVIAGIGGLSYVSHLGGYDGIGYAFSNFSLHNIWVSKQPKKYKSLYEYKEAKDKKGRKWLPEALIIGLVSIAIGIVFLVVYYII